MVRQNLTLPHDIVCITDDPFGIDSSIRIVPLWPELSTSERCWRRLKAFSPEMEQLIGKRFCWVDLDVVITGNLDAIMSRKEDAIFWAPGTTRCYINGSMCMQTAGCRAQVWERFPGLEAARKLTADSGLPGSDQSWIAAVLGPREATWTQEHGVWPYWRDCIDGLPRGARIVFFPGSLKANADVVRARSPWVHATLNAALPWNQPDYHWGERAQVRQRDRRRAEAEAKMERRLAKERAAIGAHINVTPKTQTPSSRRAARMALAKQHRLLKGLTPTDPA